MRPPVKWISELEEVKNLARPREGLREVTPEKRPGELSYFPLETFDDEVYEEAGGMTRNVMTSSKMFGLRGKGSVCFSKWFLMDGRYEWRLAQVCEEDVGAGQFLIQWDCNAKQKWVTKLNILFEGDEEEVLTERRQLAIINRCVQYVGYSCL
jgi:hypothetical protein